MQSNLQTIVEENDVSPCSKAGKRFAYSTEKPFILKAKVLINLLAIWFYSLYRVFRRSALLFNNEAEQLEHSLSSSLYLFHKVGRVFCTRLVVFFAPA